MAEGSTESENGAGSAVVATTGADRVPLPPISKASTTNVYSVRGMSPVTVTSCVQPSVNVRSSGPPAGSTWTWYEITPTLSVEAAQAIFAVDEVTEETTTPPGALGG